jgi:hypothetical protein
LFLSAVIYEEKQELIGNLNKRQLARIERHYLNSRAVF